MKHYSEIQGNENGYFSSKIAKAWGYYLVGVIVSAVGFSLPWFKFGSQAEWWYGGLQLMVYEGLPGIVLIYIGYAILALAGLLLRKQNDDFIAKAVVILSLVIVLATLIVTSAAMADAVQSLRTLDRLVWGVGLAVMLSGHALVLWGAWAAWVYQVLDARPE